MSAPELPSADVLVPFERVATMVRQLAHDVRNGLNAMELQSAFVAELLSDPEGVAEAVQEIRRLREMIAENAGMLQRFSARFHVTPLNLVTYPAKLFVEDFRDRLAKALPDFAPRVKWTEELADAAISVDVEMIFSALGESFRNTAHFQKPSAAVAAHASATNGQFQIEVRELQPAPPPAPSTWGCEPFVSTRPGGYGLGLYHARQLLAAHGGGLDFSHDAKTAQLTTRIFLPLA